MLEGKENLFSILLLKFHIEKNQANNIIKLSTTFLTPT
jgi:hypothetical protein